MDNVLSLPGRGNTYFYFSQMGKEGFSGEQQKYIRDLIRDYRIRFSRLEITAVWDFGMEEGRLCRLPRSCCVKQGYGLHFL